MGLDIYFRAYVKGKKELVGEFRNTDVLLIALPNTSGTLDKGELLNLIQYIKRAKRVDEQTTKALPVLQALVKDFDDKFDEIIYSCSY